VNQAQLVQARAAAEIAQHDYTRKRELVAKGFIAQAQVDEAQHTLEQARARVAELESENQVLRQRIEAARERLGGLAARLAFLEQHGGGNAA